MTSFPPPPRRFAELTPEGLKSLVEDMARGPGWYPSRDLYRWYEGMCADEGLIPVSAKKFGMTLKALGYQASTRRVDGKMVRGWMLTRRALQGLPPREAGQ